MGVSLMRNFAEKQADFVQALTFNDIPQEVICRTKLCFLDMVGLCLLASKLDFGKIMVEVVREFNGVKESTIIGFGELVPAPLAAMVNGTLAHGTEFCDVHYEVGSHPGACIVPAALAMGEKKKVNGKTVITAAVAGIEIFVRIGSVAPRQFRVRGYHTTPIYGTFGSAVTAAKILNLSSSQIVNAMGICGSLASGLFEFAVDGSWVKRMHPGWSAHAGLMASSLAQKGFTGPRTVYEGRFGLYRSHLGEGDYNLDRLIEGLGDIWETSTLVSKPYPCCGLSYSSMDCALHLKRKYNIDLHQIEEINCIVNEYIIPVVCEPSNVKYVPPTEYASQFSLPYAIAVILSKEENLSLDDFSEEMIKDPQILSLAKKVKYSVIPESWDPKKLYGWVRIKMKDGKVYEDKIFPTKASAGNPITDDEIREKFRRNVSKVLSESTAKELMQIIDDLEEAKDIERLMSLCS
jgi:2-methylcitrate dehydratase PrpD